MASFVVPGSSNIDSGNPSGHTATQTEYPNSHQASSSQFIPLNTQPTRRPSPLMRKLKKQDMSDEDMLSADDDLPLSDVPSAGGGGGFTVPFLDNSQPQSPSPVKPMVATGEPLPFKHQPLVREVSAEPTHFVQSPASPVPVPKPSSIFTAQHILSLDDVASIDAVVEKLDKLLKLAEAKKLVITTQNALDAGLIE